MDQQHHQQPDILSTKIKQQAKDQPNDGPVVPPQPNTAKQTETKIRINHDQEDHGNSKGNIENETRVKGEGDEEPTVLLAEYISSQNDTTNASVDEKQKSRKQDDTDEGDNNSDDKTDDSFRRRIRVDERAKKRFEIERDDILEQLPQKYKQRFGQVSVTLTHEIACDGAP
jgi:hypothetical protein